MYASKIPKSAQLFGSSPQEACSWVVGSLGQPVSFAGRTVMTCSCFLPDCQLCCDRRLAVEQQARSARCHCYSLGCPDCNPDGGQAPTDDNQFMRALHSIGGSGHPLNPDVNGVVSTIDIGLCRMLRNQGPQYLMTGRDWHTLRSKRGSRLDTVVAHLCHCGVRSVQTAVEQAIRAEGAGDKTLRAVHSISGTGRPLKPEVNEVISILEFELGRMFNNEGPQYLQKGPELDSLGGNRLKSLVAHLCHCGYQSVQTVQTAVEQAIRAEGAGDKTLPGALSRGRPSQGKPEGSEVVGRAGEPEQDECLDTLAEREQPGRLAGCSGAPAMNAI